MSETWFLLRQGSDVEELCIMYGVLSVLNDNQIPARLMKKKSAWVIESESFEPEDLFIFPMDNERELQRLATARMINNRGYEVIMKKMFGENKDGDEGYFSNPKDIKDFFQYLKTGDDQFIQKKRHGYTKETQTFFGTFFGALGQRSTFKSSMPIKVPAPIKYWSTLGFIRATSAVNINDKLELTWLPVPSETGITEVGRMDLYPMGEDKEGNEKRPAFMRSDSEYTGYAQVILKMDIWARAGQNKADYDEIFYAQTHPTGQASMNGRVDRTDFLPLSEETLYNLQGQFHPRADYDTKKALAFLLTNRQDTDFTKFIHTLAIDKNRGIELNDAKELADMFNQSDLFRHSGVVHYGKALRHLMFLNKGYDVQKDLIGVTSPEDLTRTLANLGLVYSRVLKGVKPIAMEDVSGLMDIVQDDSKRAQNVARMILLQSTAYPKKKELAPTLEEEGDQTHD